MKISIVIPIYNIDQYLRIGLDSLINQTYHNIEIVCVDDGSSDSCPQILDEYSQKDNRIKVITQNNQGTLVARKVGVIETTGDYIIFFDPDDILKSDAIEEIVNAIKKEKSDAIVFGCTFYYEGNINKDDIKFFDYHFNHCIKKQKKLDNKKDILNEVFISQNIPYNQWGKVYRTDIVKKSFTMIPDFRCIFAEDQGTALVLFNNINNVSFLNKKLYCYRVGVGISTQKQYSIEKYINSLQAFDMLEFLKKYVTKQTECQELLQQIVTDIEKSMIKTTLTLADNLPNSTKKEEWLKPLLKKCSPISLAIELMNDSTVATAKKSTYNSELEKLRKKNKKHLKQLRLSLIFSSILLLTSIFLFINFLMLK